MRIDMGLDTAHGAASYWVRRKPGDEVPIPHGTEGSGVCRAQLGPLLCTRPISHPGRHLAGIGRGLVAAAWPGSHTPTIDDLLGEVQ